MLKNFCPAIVVSPASKLWLKSTGAAVVVVTVQGLSAKSKLPEEVDITDPLCLLVTSALPKVEKSILLVIRVSCIDSVTEVPFSDSLLQIESKSSRSVLSNGTVSQRIE